MNNFINYVSKLFEMIKFPKLKLNLIFGSNNLMLVGNSELPLKHLEELIDNKLRYLMISPLNYTI